MSRFTMDVEERYEDVDADGAVGGFDANFINVNGITTRYYEEGTENEEILLLVHGGAWGASASANGWTPVLEGLSEYFHVFALDRIACGMTDNPSEESPYEWEFASEVEHVRDFLNAVGIDRCHICGNSRGMAAASWLATKYPARIQTVVCVNSHTLSPEVGDYGHRRAMLNKSVPSKATTREEVEERIRTISDYWSYNGEQTRSAEHVSATAYMLSRPKAKETAEAMAEGGKERIEREGKFKVMDEIRSGLRDGAISQPILLYWGRHDLTSTLQQGLALYEMISQGNPNVRMHIVDRAGHLVFKMYPEEFVTEVTTFVDHWKEIQRSLDDVRPHEYANYWKPTDGN